MEVRTCYAFQFGVGTLRTAKIWALLAFPAVALILTYQTHLFIMHPWHQVVIRTSLRLRLVPKTPSADGKTTLLTLTHEPISQRTLEQAIYFPLPPYLVVTIRAEFLASKLVFDPAAHRTKVVSALKAGVTTTLQVALATPHLRSDGSPNGRMLIRAFLRLHCYWSTFLTNSVLALLTCHTQFQQITQLAWHLLRCLPFQDMAIGALVVLLGCLAALSTIIIAALTALPARSHFEAGYTPKWDSSPRSLMAIKASLACFPIEARTFGAHVEIARLALPAPSHLQTHLALFLHASPESWVIFVAEWFLIIALRLFLLIFLQITNQLHHLHIFVRLSLVNRRPIKWACVFGEAIEAWGAYAMATAHDHGYFISTIVVIEADFTADLNVFRVLYDINWFGGCRIDAWTHYYIMDPFFLYGN